MSSSPSPPPPLPKPLHPAPTSSSPPKKSPALPWTHDETVALIDSYQEKWYSLKRGQLKAFQWDQVSLNVAARCGLHHPSKTATQCRHKIEKLRKRYRSELTKPGISTWLYFDLMDRMERGPTAPLDARPTAVVRASNAKPNFGSNVGPGGGYYYYDGGGGDDVSDDDESDEEWDAKCDSKSRSINNIVRGEMRRSSYGVGGRRSAKRAAVEWGGFGGGVDSDGRRVVRVTRIPMNVKQEQYYDNDNDDGDEDDSDDEDVDMPVEGRGEVEEGGEEGGGIGLEIAAQMRGFAEGFMRMENKKIEMMRDTERYRMEMEKKRMAMILDAQRKIVDTVRRVFSAAH